VLNVGNSLVRSARGRTHARRSGAVYGAFKSYWGQLGGRRPHPVGDDENAPPTRLDLDNGASVPLRRRHLSKSHQAPYSRGRQPRIHLLRGRHQVGAVCRLADAYTPKQGARGLIPAKLRLRRGRRLESESAGLIGPYHVRKLRPLASRFSDTSSCGKPARRVGFRRSGRLDLNQRPFGPQPATCVYVSLSVPSVLVVPGGAVLGRIGRCGRYYGGTTGSENPAYVFAS
jgi:hypothetical protein